jgi:hypothetical protein
MGFKSGLAAAWAFGGTPGHEAAGAAGQGADAGEEAVGGDEEEVGGEEFGEGCFVTVHLVDGGVEVGLHVGGVFEFDGGDGEAVEEDGEVGADGFAGRVDKGELTDEEEVIIGGVVEIEEGGAASADFFGGAVFEFVFDAVSEEGVEPAVVLDQCWERRMGEGADELVGFGMGEEGVETVEGFLEAGLEKELRGGGAFAGVVEFGAAKGRVAECGKGGAGGVFDELFGGCAHAGLSPKRCSAIAASK